MSHPDAFSPRAVDPREGRVSPVRARTIGGDPFDPPVYRRRPLPSGELRGRFVLADGVLEATRRGLVSFALAGLHDGGHEGMVFWTGRRDGDWTCFLQALVPDAEHGPGRVLAGQAAVGAAARAARAQQVGIVAQVHSHPGGDARHSDGDDEMVLLPFEGMLSVVVPNYGIKLRSVAQTCVHQFQEGRWVLCSAASVATQMLIVPAYLDLRPDGRPGC